MHTSLITGAMCANSAEYSLDTSAFVASWVVAEVYLSCAPDCCFTLPLRLHAHETYRWMSEWKCARGTLGHGFKYLHNLTPERSDQQCQMNELGTGNPRRDRALKSTWKMVFDELVCRKIVNIAWRHVLLASKRLFRNWMRNFCCKCNWLTTIFAFSACV